MLSETPNSPPTLQQHGHLRLSVRLHQKTRVAVKMAPFILPFSGHPEVLETFPAAQWPAVPSGTQGYVGWAVSPLPQLLGTLGRQGPGAGCHKGTVGTRYLTLSVSHSLYF